MDQPVSAATAKDDAFANLGYEILAQGPRGPLIVERTDGDALLIVLLFHTDRSTLPYRVGFPIFVSNVVQAALKQSGVAEAAPRHIGASPLSPAGFVVLLVEWWWFQRRPGIA